MMQRCVPTLFLLSLTCAAHAEDSGTGLGRHKQLYAVPVSGAVNIDGDLADWDLSGQIEMFVVGETKATQSAKFALMYDHEALYLSGVVRDPSPLMNRQDPLVSGDKGWDADACQFRLTLDPTMPYPVAIGYGSGDMADPNLLHLTLWQFTDRKEACLQLQTSMNYVVPPTATAPFGVVSAEKFSGRYAKAADGLGYAFEYRIPWSTLGAKRPLTGGDAVAGTVQFNWGQPDGLHTAGGSAWAYDVMGGPGFTFQNAGVWGRLHLAKTGKLAKELVEAGVPLERPLPLDFPYTLPADGQVSLQLVDAQKFVRRIVVAQADRRAGENIERWDGLDDHGVPLAPGTFTVEGIIHQPITTKFLFSAHNSGVPPYPTDDGKGGWGGDHGNPQACSTVPGGMLLAWDSCEYGWGIIRVDTNGRKLWGSKSTATLLANDGQHFFAYSTHSFNSLIGVQQFDLVDGRPVNFANGEPCLQHPAQTAEKSATESNEISGLAYAGGKLYVSYGKRDLIAVYLTSGKLEATWKIPAPGALAVRPDGSLIGISAGTLAALTIDGAVKIADSGLDAPAGVAVSADGTIYVSNAGKSQDVAVFAADGKPQKRIGKAGGRPAVGAYDANGVYMPGGVAVDERGRLWVAETTDSPKRISVWNTRSGAFEQEFFGASGYFGYAFINPAVPSEIYCHNVLWRINWDTNTTTPISTMWRRTSEDMVEEPSPDGYAIGLPFRTITASNGTQYGLGAGALKYIAYRRDKDLFKPFLSVFDHRGWIYGGAVPVSNDPNQPGDGAYLWQDANDDQRAQPSEITRFSVSTFQASPKVIGPDLTLYLSGGNRLKPVRILPNGQPIYDAKQVENTALTNTPHGSGVQWLGDDGSLFTQGAGLSQLSKWNVDGTLAWGFPGIPGWHESLGLPVVKPGRLHGLTGGLGVAGQITGSMTYFGACHLFTTNGIYAAQVMRDGRLSGLGADIGQPEGQGGALVSVVTKPGTAPRTLLLAGGQDGRVTEVLGLDTITELPRSTYTLTAEQVQTAGAALAAYNTSIGQNTRLVIGNDIAKIASNLGVSKAVDADRRFTVRAAHDANNLVLHYEVTAPAELISAATDPTLLFKSGNCIDVQLAAVANADVARSKLAVGDLRLLISQQRIGQSLTPIAVIYRPVKENSTTPPIVLSSPTGSESFAEIAVLPDISIAYSKSATGFTAVVTIPLEKVGLQLKAGTQVRMDVGYLYGNTAGTQTAVRSYWSNSSFTAQVLMDIPHESRLEPANWGLAEVK